MTALETYIRREKQQVLFTKQNLNKVVNRIREANNRKQLDDSIPRGMLQYNKKEKIPDPLIRQVYAKKYRELGLPLELSLTPTVYV
jgi:hypothetical protein